VIKMSDVQIILRLKKEMNERITQIVRENGYHSRQEFIYEAIRNYIDEKTNTRVKRLAVYHDARGVKLPHGDKL
jgi:metal-responsive CopG/Arc/MetJ family transcriptional regulator